MRKNEKWTIAYRRRSDGKTLLDDLSGPFCVVPNTWRYWRADPFLFEKEGKTYLFAELFDRVKARGVLGCCELTDSGAKRWEVIIDEPFHLSYPFIFQRGDEIYLIPESFKSGKIILYKAVRFPNKWIKVRELVDLVAVDSTIIDTAAGSFMMTVRILKGEAELVIMCLNEQMQLEDVRIISEKGDPHIRPAGNVFSWNNQTIRPAQDCTKTYGYGLNFFRVAMLDDIHYSEELMRKVLPEDITIQGVRNPQGMHTYNFSDQYEVIDFKEYEFGVVGKVAKAIRLLTGKTL